MLFFGADESRPGAEEFRTLRSRLYQIREKMPLKRLLVTSALPKEGQVFRDQPTLARCMVRQQGRRVLMIDADLRNPGHAPPSSAPLRRRDCPNTCWASATSSPPCSAGPMENLFFMPAGRIAPVPPNCSPTAV